MYGAKYIGHYKALLYLWYKEGSSNSEMKVSPSLMEKMLWAMYPGIYTKPSFTEIKSFVSQLFLKEKKNEDIGICCSLSFCISSQLAMVSSNILLPTHDEVLYMNMSMPCLSAVCDTPFAHTLRPCSPIAVLYCIRSPM